MIRQFIRDTIADLANAVARSELAAENARLASRVKDLERTVNQNVEAGNTLMWERDDARKQRDDLRARLEAAEKLTTAEAVAHICRELQSDSGYRIVWVANIAMQFKDRVSKHKSGGPDVQTMYVMDRDDLHKLANEAAEGFIDILCKDAQPPARELFGRAAK